MDEKERRKLRNKNISTIILIVSLSLLFSEILVGIGGYFYLRNGVEGLGDYNPFTRMISIAGYKGDIATMHETCTHEVGHEVNYYRINRSMKKEFKLISLLSSMGNAECFYSYNNKTSEDFAESYSRYFHSQQLCLEKEEYFNKVADAIGILRPVR